MPGQKFLQQGNGVLVEATAIQSSAGAADSGKIVGLDATGRWDPSTMPVGIAADTAAITASEALASGDFVNVWDSGGGTFRVRKADASGANAGKRAHGYVLANVSNAGVATVYFEGTNTQVSGMTPGDVFLSATTPGQATATAPSGAGNTVQRLGVAVSATSINVEFNIPIVLA